MRAGGTLVTLQWGDLQEVRTYYCSKLKIAVEQNKVDIQRALDSLLLMNLLSENYQKVCDIVQEVFLKVQARLVEVSQGCVQLTIVHLTRDSYQKIHDSVVELEEIFNSLLLTDRMREISPSVKLVVQFLTSAQEPNTQIGLCNNVTK